MLPAPHEFHCTNDYNYLEGAFGDDEDPARPHVCPVAGCPRRFKRRFTLKEHVKTHSGAKPYVCPVASCGKSFTTSGNLSRHKRAHPWLTTTFECLIVGCGCTFTTETKLERHIKMAHFGSSTHLCPRENCGGAFSTAGNLKRHLQLQHADEGITSPVAKSQVEKEKPETTPTDAIGGEEEFTWPSFTTPARPEQSLLQPTDVELLEALSCLFEAEPHNNAMIV